MSGVITYALPALQLVCHLVSEGNSHIGGTTHARAFPPGYVAYPSLGVAYKVHNELVTWETAKERCAREGAYLATMDNFEKIQIVRKQQPSKNLTHVGYYMKDGDDINWYNVHTGLTTSCLPWAPSEPSGIGRCAMINYGEIGLGRYGCLNAGDYVCQISYP